MCHEAEFPVMSQIVSRIVDSNDESNIFTDSALWAGSVIESPCPSVCHSVILSFCLSVPSGAVFLERSSSHHNFHTVRARDLKF